MAGKRPEDEGFNSPANKSRRADSYQPVEFVDGLFEGQSVAKAAITRIATALKAEFVFTEKPRLQHASIVYEEEPGKSVVLHLVHAEFRLLWKKQELTPMMQISKDLAHTRFDGSFRDALADGYLNFRSVHIRGRHVILQSYDGDVILQSAGTGLGDGASLER